MPLEETENEIRARIQNPGKFDPDSFRYKPFPPNNPERGVFALYGCPKGEWRGGRCQVGVQIQSFRFSKDAGWTVAKARAWLKEHDFKVVARKIGELAPDEITPDDIMEQFYIAMVNALEDEYFKTGIHITDITRDCLRPAYYRTIYGGIQFYGLWTTYLLWKGKMLHLTNVLPQGEIKVEWSGVKGRIDDYDPKTGVIVEKKIIGRIPTEPLPHHIKQIQFQAVLMRENGNEVNRGFILYISPDNKKAAVFEVPVTVADLVDAKAEISEKAEVLKKAFADSTIPPRKTTWECAYCPYFTPCLAESKVSEFTYHASITAEKDRDHYARIYLCDTSICGNNWRITDEALERAGKSIIGKPLMMGHGAPEGSEVGEFVDYIKEEGRLYGLAKITDDETWGHIKAGDWGAVSVEFIAKKITCSECGADITENAETHDHIVNRAGHMVIEDLVFDKVALIDNPAYPRAKVEEVDGITDVWSYDYWKSSGTTHPYSVTVMPQTGTYFPTDDQTDFTRPVEWCELSKKLTAELEKPRQKGKPRPDRQRLIEHFGEEMALKLLELVGDDAYKLLPERGTRLSPQAGDLKFVRRGAGASPGARGVGITRDEKRNAQIKNGGKKVTDQEERIAELEQQLKTANEEHDGLKAELEKSLKETQDKLAEMEKAQHEAKVAELVDLRIQADLVTEAAQEAEIKRLGEFPDPALDQLITDIKKPAQEETPPSKPNPKAKAGGEKLSAIEEQRERLFGYRRDGMASDGGKIVRG